MEFCEGTGCHLIPCTTQFIENWFLAHPHQSRHLIVLPRSLRSWLFVAGCVVLQAQSVLCDRLHRERWPVGAELCHSSIPLLELCIRSGCTCGLSARRKKGLAPEYCSSIDCTGRDFWALAQITLLDSFKRPKPCTVCTCEALTDYWRCRFFKVYRQYLSYFARKCPFDWYQKLTTALTEL